MKDKLYPWMVLSVTGLGNLLSGLNLSTLNVALPEVASHFQAGAITGSWILLSFMLVNTILILVFGRIADIYGRRRLYIFGLTLFTLTSLLVGLSPNIWVLILLRVLQAVGSALIISNITPLITDAFPEKTLGIALGFNIFIVSISHLIGPALGGYLVFAFGWRWVFWFNVPIGIIGIIWAVLVLKPAPGRPPEEKIDAAGNITLFLGLSGLILALSQGGVVGWHSTPVIAAWVVFFVFLALFIWIERRTDYPVVDFTLFHNRPFTMGVISAFLNTLVRYSIVLLMALFFQVAEGKNSMTAGLQILPVAGGMLIGSPLSGYLSTKYSTRFLTTTGLLCTGLGVFILMHQIVVHASFLWIFAGQFLTGFGSGVFMTANTKSIMMTVPKARRGVANGIRSMMMNMGQLVTTALSLMIVTSRLPLYLKGALFAGAGASLGDSDVYLIALGYRTTFTVMLLITALAITVSYFRNQKNESNQYNS